MAMCNRTPLNPTAIEAAAITAGPVRNLTAIANDATEFPQAMIFGCNAINKPAIPLKEFIFGFIFDHMINISSKNQSVNSPRLNIAIPRPASDRIDMERAIIAGISTFHLQILKHISTLRDTHIQSKLLCNDCWGSKMAYLKETRDQVRPMRLE